MARGSLFVAALREVERSNRRNQRAVIAQVRAVERAERERQRQMVAREKSRLRNDRDLARQVIVSEREQREAYLQGRSRDVDEMNRSIAEQVHALESVLHATLLVDDYFDINKLKLTIDIPGFDPGNLVKPEPLPESIPFAAKPEWSSFVPIENTGMSRFMPGAKAKHERFQSEARELFKKALAAHEELIAKNERAYAAGVNEHALRESRRLEDLKAKASEYEANAMALRQELTDQHAGIEQFKQEFERSEPKAVAEYFALVLEYSSYPDSFPRTSKVAFLPDSHQLVVDFEFPGFDVVPQIRLHKFIRAKDDTTSNMRPATERKRLYASVLAQVALRTVHELFEADRAGKLTSVVFNGHVSTVDRATGRAARPCLLTLRTTRDTFTAIDLSNVDPEACLRGLSAGVSRSPAELSPVRPVIEFNMVDSRFVEETDVLSGLDQRPNLMSLSPNEFEHLITNLFERMGLETRLTQASRDGGVDCVAYAPRPVFGGKVVIQAKRYKNTVGVSAVRDLFGTMQNEGASKGILVTTSGYGSASYDFANNKPLELLDGSNLVYLLSEHAGIEAKIEPPEDWVDPVADMPGAG